ncbi:GNAT family N-acetyltransferase [Zooshikella ganghwensis]|uniref:GNAT family N-acetyltransferase n=1 Tax=Zooshikella ganghwensis TaxID=202772 RepID=UPI00041EB7D2|nr:GNAT family N-acetyltransferase [Zooshikella ganghwensis]
MNIKQINAEDVLPVRHQVLWPEKPIEFCCVDEDVTGIHFGVYLDQRLVSVASIYIDGTQARLRKLATLNDYQGKGIGSALIEYVLTYLMESRIQYLWCDARESARSFYQRLGFKVFGERFFKSSVPYFKMGLVL